MGKWRPILVLVLLALAGLLVIRHLSSRDQNPARQSDNSAPATERKRPPGSTAAKLRDIQLPAFKVEDISVAEFVEYLRVRSIAYDENPGEFPGVDIRIFTPPPERLLPLEKEAGGLGARYTAEEIRIRELALASMSVEEVLLYAFESSKFRYEIKDEIVWIHHVLYPPVPYEKSRTPEEPGSEIDPFGSN